MFKIRTLVVGLVTGSIVAGLAFLIPASIRKTTDIPRDNGLILPDAGHKLINGHGYVLRQGWDNNSDTERRASCMAISTHRTATGFPFVQEEVRGACGENVKYNNIATVLNFLFWMLAIGVAAFGTSLFGRWRKARR